MEDIHKLSKAAELERDGMWIEMKDGVLWVRCEGKVLGPRQQTRRGCLVWF